MPEERPRRAQHTNEQDNNKKSSGWQLIAVQSISCVAVILIALAFRMIGGSAFTELRDSFNKSIMSNSIVATLAALINSPSSDSGVQTGAKSTAGSTGTTQTGTTTSTSTSGTSAAASNATTTTQAASAKTTAAATAAAKASVAKTSATAKAVGGHDIQVGQKKVLYAPTGATFAPIKVNRLAEKPLGKGKVSSYFGYRENPKSGEDSFHQGLDIAADSGSSISAMYFGVVREVGQNSSYGNYIRIYHGNGMEILYAHCSQIPAEKDAFIRAGEVVARVGSTGDSTGPHVHIEVTLNGVAYDPAGIVNLKDYD